MSTPNVRGFFDTATATWTYVVWSATDAQRRCAIIDSVLDFDLHACRTSTTSADAVIAFWNGKGTITGELIGKAQIKGLPCRVIRY